MSFSLERASCRLNTAYGEESASRDLAALVLSEWWTPDAIPKPLDD